MTAALLLLLWVLTAGCWAVREAAAGQVLSDPEIWRIDQPRSRALALAYDSTAGVLYEAGFRSTDILTGNRLPAKGIYARGIVMATGVETFYVQSEYDSAESKSEELKCEFWAVAFAHLLAFDERHTGEFTKYYSYEHEVGRKCRSLMGAFLLFAGYLSCSRVCTHLPLRIY